MENCPQVETAAVMAMDMDMVMARVTARTTPNPNNRIQNAAYKKGQSNLRPRSFGFIIGPEMEAKILYLG